LTKLVELNDAVDSVKVLETTASNGVTQTSQLGRLESIDKPGSTSNVTQAVGRDALGGATSVSYESSDGTKQSATIIRDKNHSPVELKDRYGNEWKKVSADQWSETSPKGQKSKFNHKILVGNNGDITFSSAKQTIVEPITGDMQDVLDNQGKLVSAMNAPYLTDKYAYSQDGKQVTQTSTQDVGDTTTITRNQEPSNYYQELLPLIDFF
jgi:hypothetical protein